MTKTNRYDSTPTSRLETHRTAVDGLSMIVNTLTSRLIFHAMNLHDEIEELHARLDHLELMHHDPAAHGRGILQHASQPPSNVPPSAGNP